MHNDTDRDIFEADIEAVRLHDAIMLSHKELQPFRDKMDEMVREYIGPNHGDNIAPNPNMNNQIRKYVDIIKNMLAPGEPRVIIDTFTGELRASANSLQKAVNRKIIDADLGTVITDCVGQSLFTMGIIKVGLNQSDTIEIGGLKHDVMEPYAESIEFDDFTWDLEANRFEKCQFVANRVNIPLKDVKPSGLFDKEAIDAIEKHGRLHSERRQNQLPANRLATGQYKHEPFRESIDVWSVWMPFEKRSILLLDDTVPVILRDVEYYGPETGPYHLLGMSDVPGNIMPASPVANLLALHKQGNRIYAKTARQADRSKTIGAVRDKGTEDAIKIKNANDGDMIGLQDPASLTEITTGGANPGLVGMNKVVDDTFNKNAGNVDQVGGLASQADTLGQEKLLSENASVQIQGMAKRVDKVAKSAIKAIAWYMYDDPTSVIKIKKEIVGVKGITVFSQFGPEDRTADFINYDVAIQPYSLNDSTPQQLVAAVNRLMTEILVPMAPQLAEQGLTLDMAEYVTYVGDNLNLPVIPRIVVSQDGEALTDRDKESTADKPKQAPVTERHNFRHQVTPEEEFDPVAELQTAETAKDS